MEIILGSVVLSAIISGVISIYTYNRRNKLKYITKERKEWRNEIRKCSEKLRNLSYSKTLKVCDRLKVRINAYGKCCSNRYSSDAHIWEVINEIEKGECGQNKLHKLQSILQDYLSLLLKSDWERTKKEVSGDNLRGLEVVLWIVSALIYTGGLVYNVWISEVKWSNEIVVQILACLFIYIQVIAFFGFLEKEMEETSIFLFVGHVLKKKRNNLEWRYGVVNIVNMIVMMIAAVVYAVVIHIFTSIIITNMQEAVVLITLFSNSLGWLAIGCRLYLLQGYIDQYYKYAYAVDQIHSEFLSIESKEEPNELT